MNFIELLQNTHYIGKNIRFKVIRDLSCQIFQLKTHISYIQICYSMYLSVKQYGMR